MILYMNLHIHPGLHACLSNYTAKPLLWVNSIVYVLHALVYILKTCICTHTSTLTWTFTTQSIHLTWLYQHLTDKYIFHACINSYSLSEFLLIKLTHVSSTWMKSKLKIYNLYFYSRLHLTNAVVCVNNTHR